MYQMQRAKQTFDKSNLVYAVGRLMFDPEKRYAKFVMQDRDGQTKEYGPMDITECTSDLKRVMAAKDSKEPMVKEAAKLWSVRLNVENADRPVIEAVHPAEGRFVFTTKHFVAPEGQEPSLKETEKTGRSRDGKEYREVFEYFFVVFEIVYPKEFKGLTVTVRFRSTGGREMFSSALVNGKNVLIYGASGKHVDFLDQYLQVAGWLQNKYQPTEYTDDPLSGMQKIILHEDKRFWANLKNGFITPDTFSPFGDEDDAGSLPFDEDDATTTTPAPTFSTGDEIPWTPVEETEPDDDDDDGFVD